MIQMLLAFLILVPFGQDYLGGAKFQSAIIQSHDYSQGAGMFATTFGDSLPLANALADRRIPFLRIQLGWSDTHSYSERDFPELVKQARRFCPLHTKTKLYLSGACEHNLDVAKATKLANQVLAACPQATYVNTPWKGAVLPQFINETHGDGDPKSAKSSYSSDGKPSEDINIQKLKDKPWSEFFMFWSPRYNGRWEDNDSTPRPQRRGYADGKMIKSMLALAKPKGATSLPKNWIYKSHSENKGNGDSRAEKPVIIAPVKKASLKIGNATCPYYGSYDNGRSRYYCKIYGYEISQTPVKLDRYGTINPTFRDGVYR
jgi:hypothetical protein